MMTVMTNTRVKDLKVGDLVVTGEIMRITKINTTNFSNYRLGCVHVRPQCHICGPKCKHEFWKNVGWGQQSVQKIISRKGG